MNRFSLLTDEEILDVNEDVKQTKTLNVPKKKVRFKDEIKDEIKDEGKFVYNPKFAKRRSNDSFNDRFEVYVKFWIISSEKDVLVPRGIACSFHNFIGGNLDFWREQFRFETIGFLMRCENIISKKRIIAMTELGQVILLKCYDQDDLTSIFDFIKGPPYRLTKRMDPRKVLDELNITEMLSSYGLIL